MSVGRRLGQEDLAAVTGRADPRGPVDVGPDVLAIRIERAVAGVEAHPDADRDAVRPRLRGETPLGVDRRRDGRRTARRNTAKMPSPSVFSS